jgi:hypothetical protein
MFRLFRTIANRQQVFRILEKASNLEKEGKIKEAVVLCQEVVNKNPNVDLFRSQLGMLQDALQQKEGSVEEAEKIACRPYKFKR